MIDIIARPASFYVRSSRQSLSQSGRIEAPRPLIYNREHISNVIMYRSLATPHFARLLASAVRHMDAFLQITIIKNKNRKKNIKWVCTHQIMVLSTQKEKHRYKMTTSFKKSCLNTKFGFLDFLLFVSVRDETTESNSARKRGKEKEDFCF